MKAFLFIAVVAVLWALSLLLRPFGRCWRCGGRGNVRKGRRAPRCRACSGRGRRQRLGSQTVHRARRLAVQGWRERGK